jgi:hypothetical protein
MIVLAQIYESYLDLPPHPSPLPQGEGAKKNGKKNAISSP